MQTRDLSFMDGSSDSFPKGPYDLAYSNFVLNRVRDKEAAFRNVRRNQGRMDGFVHCE